MTGYGRASQPTTPSTGIRALLPATSAHTAVHRKTPALRHGAPTSPPSPSRAILSAQWGTLALPVSRESGPLLLLLHYLGHRSQAHRGGETAETVPQLSYRLCGF